jgi:hypothetical protein
MSMTGACATGGTTGMSLFREICMLISPRSGTLNCEAALARDVIRWSSCMYVCP